jgi:Uma2 family endonuclease
VAVAEVQSPPTDREVLAQPCRLLTAADLAELPAELPSGTVRYELDNGRLVVMSPPGNKHSAAQSNIIAALKFQGEAAGHGKARTEVAVVLWRSPDRIVAPDAAFIAKASLPIRETPEGYLETKPDLVVEIVSKNDSAAYIERKVSDYLLAGVRVVWTADPQTRRVVEHRSGVSPRVYESSDDLTVEDVVPGFRIKVSDVFTE